MPAGDGGWSGEGGHGVLLRGAPGTTWVILGAAVLGRAGLEFGSHCVLSAVRSDGHMGLDDLVLSQFVVLYDVGQSCQAGPRVGGWVADQPDGGRDEPPYPDEDEQAAGRVVWDEDRV